MQKDSSLKIGRTVALPIHTVQYSMYSTVHYGRHSTVQCSTLQYEPSSPWLLRWLVCS